MSAPVTFVEGFITEPDTLHKTLWNELDWEHRDGAPRFEHWANDYNMPYTYGKGAGVRTYYPRPWHPAIKEVQARLLEMTGVLFEGCFCNGYRDHRDHLGWHADDSPEIDHSKPIAVISIGAEREIWFCPQADRDAKEAVLLKSGSLLLMQAGMQHTHYHRIPKHSAICGPRISLTFRGLLGK